MMVLDSGLLFWATLYTSGGVAATVDVAARIVINEKGRSLKFKLQQIIQFHIDYWIQYVSNYFIVFLFFSICKQVFFS